MKKVVKADSVIRKLRHFPAFFSIAVTGLMIYKGGPKDDTLTFGILNYLFASGIIIYIFLEHMTSDVKSHVRVFSLWASVFMSLIIVFSLKPEYWLFAVLFLLCFLISISGVIIYTFLEYRTSDVKSYIRIFSLWASVFMSLPLVFMHTNTGHWVFEILLAIGFLVAIVSPLIFIALILLLLTILFFIKKQLEFSDFYPIIFGFLSVIWLLSLLEPGLSI